MSGEESENKDKDEKVRLISEIKEMMSKKKSGI